MAPPRRPIPPNPSDYTDTVWRNGTPYDFHDKKAYKEALEEYKIELKMYEEEQKEWQKLSKEEQQRQIKEERSRINSKLIRNLRVLFITGHVGFLLMWVLTYFGFSIEKGFGSPSSSNASIFVRDWVVGPWTLINQSIQHFVGSPISYIIAVPLTYILFIIIGNVFFIGIVFTMIFLLIKSLIGLFS